MPIHTPDQYDKHARARAIDERYEKARDAARGAPPRDRAALEWGHCLERYVELGLETYRGASAMYHFDDTVRGLWSAAWTISNEPGYTPRQRPSTAVDHLLYIYGGRYSRAFRALIDGLTNAGLTVKDLANLNQHCAGFERLFFAMADRFYELDCHRERRRVAAQMIELFARHVQSLLPLIGRTSERYRVHGLTGELEGVFAKLRQVRN